MRVLWNVYIKINELLVMFASILAGLFMILVVCDVTGRYIFSKPIIGTYEVGEVVLAFILCMGLASVQLRNEHINVTVLLDRISLKWRAWLEILIIAIGFFLVFLITWKTVPFVVHSFEIKEKGQEIGILSYIPKLGILVGFALLCIQFLIDIIRKVYAKVHATTPGKEI
jgi:TRAP-type C4-dicarboxylate transport system permease small subunit